MSVFECENNTSFMGGCPTTEVPDSRHRSEYDLQVEHYTIVCTKCGNHASCVRNTLEADAARYRFLRSADLDSVEKGGIFAGKTPDNIVINGFELDDIIDEAIRIKERRKKLKAVE